MSDSLTTQTRNKAYRIGVAVAVPLRKIFDYYFVADQFAAAPQVGCRVQVPFGRQQKVGIVMRIDTNAYSEFELQEQKLKAIDAVIDPQPIIDEQLLSLHQWMQKYYHAAPGELWHTLLPNALLQGKPAQIKRRFLWQISDSGLRALEDNQLSKRAIKQRHTLSLFKQHGKAIAQEELSAHDLSLNVVKTLAEKGWLKRQLETLSADTATVNENDKRKLNEEQAKAVNTLGAGLKHFSGYLLQGVTASGKTEVYLQIIESVVKAGKQALVLVPEIGLTPQTLQRFRARFKGELVVLHSQLSDSERLQGWLKARQGLASIIIGTRSALFVPLARPGIIILDEEHDRSYKQQQGVRYSARDVALVRGQQLNIPVLLGSATPSFESLYNAECGKLKRLLLTQKVSKREEPSYHIIDMKRQPLREGLSHALLDKIKAHLASQGQVLLFLNRRGYAPVLLCHECGWSAECKRCDLNFTYHQARHQLECHHCAAQRPVPTHCPECRSHQLVNIGMGTERLQQSIELLFPKARVRRIDRDTTRGKSAMQDFVNEIKSGEVDILIGTQMLAKGHHFSRLTLAAIVDMDAALYSSDFRAPELAAQLMVQVAGRVGRGERPGEVVLQTHLADHPMLRLLVQSGYEAFAKESLQERQQAELPPYAHQALLQAEANRIDYCRDFLQQAASVLALWQNHGVDILGPAPATYAKKAGKYRFQLWLQAKQRHSLHHMLREALPQLETLPNARRVRWRLEIDPVDDT